MDEPGGHISDDEAWSLEEQFWTGHRPFHEKTVGGEAIMCFGDPLGVLKGKDAMDALDRAPDWADVRMQDRVLSRPAENIVLLGYLAEGRTEDGALHRVYCSSAWVSTEGAWKQVQHQQTPA